MKAVSKLVVSLSLVLSAVAASAATMEQTYLETCRKGSGIPVPISVVSPTVDAEYSGSQVDLEFTVDQQGNPTNLSVLSPSDKSLASAVVAAVKQWKFKPAERNGTPVATKVVLPVRVVDPVLAGADFAAN